MNRTIKAIMAITADYVRQVFKGLESGDGAEFFAHVADDVDWIVEGTHPLAGHYRSKADFMAGLAEIAGSSAQACRTQLT